MPYGIVGLWEVGDLGVLGSVSRWRVGSSLRKVAYRSKQAGGGATTVKRSGRASSRVGVKRSIEGGATARKRARPSIGVADALSAGAVAAAGGEIPDFPVKQVDGSGVLPEGGEDGDRFVQLCTRVFAQHARASGTVFASEGSAFVRDALQAVAREGVAAARAIVEEDEERLRSLTKDGRLPNPKNEVARRRKETLESLKQGYEEELEAWKKAEKEGVVVEREEEEEMEEKEGGGVDEEVLRKYALAATLPISLKEAAADLELQADAVRGAARRAKAIAKEAESATKQAATALHSDAFRAYGVAHSKRGGKSAAASALRDFAATE